MSPLFDLRPEANGVFVGQGAQSISVQDAAYAAPGNAQRIQDGAITATQSLLGTASWASFVPGMVVYVAGAGATPSGGSGGAAMRAIVMSTSVAGVVLSVAATATVTGAQVDYGNDDGPAFRAAAAVLSALGGGDLTIPKSKAGAYILDVDATNGSWPQQVTPTGYGNAINYAVAVPSNVKVKAARGAIIRFPFNGLSSAQNSAAFVTNGASPILEDVEVDGCAVTGGNVESNTFAAVLYSSGGGSCDSPQLRFCRFHHGYGKGFFTQGSGGVSGLLALGVNAYRNLAQLATLGNVTDGQVIGCRCHDNLNYPTTSAEGIIVSNCSRVTFDDYSCINQGTSISMTQANDHIIIGHVNTIHPIAMTGTIADVTISDCVIDVSALTTTIGIQVSSTTTVDLKIVDNDVIGNTSACISVQPTGTSSALDISGNTVYSGNIIAGGGGGTVTGLHVNKNILNNGATLDLRAGVSQSVGCSVLGGTLLVGCSNAVVDAYVSGPASAGAYAVSISGGNNKISGVFLGNHTDGTSATLRTTGASALNNEIGPGICLALGAGTKTIWDGQTSADYNHFHNMVLALGATAAVLGGTGSHSTVRDCPGRNPYGFFVVAVPGTGVAISLDSLDAIFYITGNAGGATTVTLTNAGGGSAGTVTIPASATVPVFVPAGFQMTPTYTSAPTWVTQLL